MTSAEIIALRAEMRVSRRKFAALFGVTPRTVQNWERGGKIAEPSAKLLAQIATFFGKPEGGK